MLQNSVFFASSDKYPELKGTLYVWDKIVAPNEEREKLFKSSMHMGLGFLNPRSCKDTGTWRHFVCS